MTNQEVHEQVVLWLGSLLGITVIKDRQGGDRPAVPYAMVDLSNWGDLHQHVERINYRETTDENIEGKTIIMATPIIEIEWTFLLFVYGPQADEYIRQVQAAVHLFQTQEELVPKLVVTEVSRANSIPELIDERWEPRVQVNLTVRGKSDHEFLADIIEKHNLEVERT